MSDISKFTKIARAPGAANDIWGVLKYHELVFIPNTLSNRAVSAVYTTRQKNFAHITGTIFTHKYFKFVLNTVLLASANHILGISQSVVK